jgi:hypothetical protein
VLDHSDVPPDSKPSEKIVLSTVAWIASLWSLRNLMGACSGRRTHCRSVEVQAERT